MKVGVLNRLSAAKKLKLVCLAFRASLKASNSISGQPWLILPEHGSSTVGLTTPVAGPCLAPHSRMCNDDMPSEDGIPSVKISETYEYENLEPLQARTLSRSPHPYHRRQSERVADLQWDGGKINLPTLKTLESTDGGYDKLTITSENIARRVKAPASASDSGTEADDESGLVLQSLPAPPLRWHKGLKGQDGEGSASPLLTPSYLDDESQGLELERQLSRHADEQSSASINDGRRRIREKFTRRRRAELLRRLSETILLGIVGYIAFLRQTDLIVGVWRPGTP